MRYARFAWILALFAIGCAEGEKGLDGVAPVEDAAPEVAVLDGTADAPVDAASDADAATDGDASVDGDADATPGADADADAAPEADADAAVDGAIDAEVDAASDTALADSGVDVAVDAGLPWSHTIAIDGTNDFDATNERFSTTSTGYFAYVTWDATNLYVAYSGPDVKTTASPTKWLFFYFDVDPGAGTGAANGEKYNTQTPKMPSGFGAEHYLRWKSDDTFASIKSYAASAWSDLTTTVTRSRGTDFVEFRIPRTTFGTATKIGLVSFWLNEAGGIEAAYGGLYSGSFTDGYHASVPLSSYLLVDFTSPLPPNDPSRKKP